MIRLEEVLEERSHRDLELTAGAHGIAFSRRIPKAEGCASLRAELLSGAYRKAFESLNAGDKTALQALVVAGGALPLILFSHHFGVIRPYRPWRKDYKLRHIWRSPISIAEKLYQLAFIHIEDAEMVYIVTEAAEWLAAPPKAAPETRPFEPEMPIHRGGRWALLRDMAAFLGLCLQIDEPALHRRWFSLSALRQINQSLLLPEDMSTARSELQTGRLRWLHYLAQVTGLLSLQARRFKPTLSAWDWLAASPELQWECLMQSIERDLASRQRLWDVFRFPELEHFTWLVLRHTLDDLSPAASYRLKDILAMLQPYLLANNPYELACLVRDCFVWLGVLLNGHIQRLEVSLERGKLRIPFNGGRYYVMTSDVAESAGLKIQVERGQVHLDPNTARAWVNRDDWLQMPESQQGIKHILGGADQDDALWVHGYTDHDGSRKILAWRSPNNTGEYVTLQPTKESQPMLWHTPDGETVMYPKGDSRKLTARIDQTEGQTQYLNLAQDPQEGELGQGKVYSPELMDEVNQRTLENSGILGGYCNFTMGFKGTVGRTPKVLPDTLERVIDNDVKLGGSNALVGEKIEEMTLQFLQSGVPIPKFLLPRFGVYPDSRTGDIPKKKKFGIVEGEEKKEIWVNVRTTDSSHWVDQLATGVQNYLERMHEYRDEKMASARLPAAVHDSIAGDGEALQLGARFNSLYTQSLREARSKYAHIVTTSPQEDFRQHETQRKQYNNLIMDYVRQKSEAFLEEQPEERHSAILRGAMVSREMNAKDPKKTTSDSAFWQRGKVAETSLRSLQELGLLGEIVEETNERGTRLVRYPSPEKAQQQATYHPVEIKQVWFNREIAGKGSPPSMKGIEPAAQKQRKAEVRSLAQRSHEQGGFLGQKLRVGEHYFGMDAAPSMVFEDDKGRVFGVIPKKQALDWFVGEEIVIRQAKGSDGNLTAMVERVTPNPNPAT